MSVSYHEMFERGTTNKGKLTLRRIRSDIYVVFADGIYESRRSSLEVIGRNLFTASRMGISFSPSAEKPFSVTLSNKKSTFQNNGGFSLDLNNNIGFLYASLVTQSIINKCEGNTEGIHTFPQIFQ